MVILTRKRRVVSRELIGLTDGENKLFQTPHKYRPGKIKVLVNGQVLTTLYDFTEMGGNEIKFNWIAPEVGDTLIATYEV